MDYSMQDDGKTLNNIPLEPSTIENIDVGFFEHIDENFNIHATTNRGPIKVPILWLAAERTHQIKNNQEIRDSVGRLKLPIITIERESMEKDPSFKGAYQSAVSPNLSGPRSYRGGGMVVSKRIVKEKTRNFAAANAAKIVNDTGKGQEWFPKQNKQIVYEEVIVPIPTYVKIMYSIVLKTEYQQQLNEMITPFITKTGNINHFVFSKNNYNYEAFIDQNFGQESNAASLGEDERVFTAKIKIKVLGYLSGDPNHDPTPKVVKRENVVELKISRERVIVGDEIPWKSKDNKYRG